MFSQTKPFQTKPYQTKPTVNHLKNSQNKLDFDETFTVALDGWCCKPDQTLPYQTLPYQTKPNTQKYKQLLY